MANPASSLRNFTPQMEFNEPLQKRPRYENSLHEGYALDFTIYSQNKARDTLQRIHKLLILSDKKNLPPFLQEITNDLKQLLPKIEVLETKGLMIKKNQLLRERFVFTTEPSELKEKISEIYQKGIEILKNHSDALNRELPLKFCLYSLFQNEDSSLKKLQNLFEVAIKESLELDKASEFVFSVLTPTPPLSLAYDNQPQWAPSSLVIPMVETALFSNLYVSSDHSVKGDQQKVQEILNQLSLHRFYKLKSPETHDFREFLVGIKLYLQKTDSYIFKTVYFLDAKVLKNEKHEKIFLNLERISSFLNEGADHPSLLAISKGQVLSLEILWILNAYIERFKQQKNIYLLLEEID